MRQYIRKGGWYGNSHGHSLAAQGIKLYAARKQTLIDPIFYSHKREQDVPNAHMREMIREGYTFRQIKEMHPDSDPETIRATGIRVLNDNSGNNILEVLNSNGVDANVKIAAVNPAMGSRMRAALEDEQKASFLPDVKVQLLKKRLGEMDNER